MRPARELTAWVLLGVVAFLPVGGALGLAHAVDAVRQTAVGGIGPATFWSVYLAALGAVAGAVLALVRAIRRRKSPPDPRIAWGILFATAIFLGFVAPVILEIAYWRAPLSQTFEPGEWIWWTLGALAMPLPPVAAWVWRRRQPTPSWKAAFLPGAILWGGLCCAAVILFPSPCRYPAPSVRPPDRAARAPSSQVLLVVVDGLTWKVVDPLIAQGRAPNLAALAARGARGDVLPATDFNSFAILASMATGYPTPDHGIRDYHLIRFPGLAPVWMDRRTSRRYYLAAPLLAAKLVNIVWPERRNWVAPPIWELLMAAGERCHVVAWHGYTGPPATPVRGTIAGFLAFPNPWEALYTAPVGRDAHWWSDRDVESLRALVVRPWELTRAELDPVVTLPDEIFDEVRTSWDTSTKDRIGFHVARAFALDQSTTGVLEALLASDTPALAAIHYTGFDLYAHIFWHYRFPEEGARHPRLEAAPAPNPSYAEAVDRYLETLDGYIGRLVSRLHTDATVIVVSDHGMAVPIVNAQRIWRWEHCCEGVFLAAGPAIRSVRDVEIRPPSLAPTILRMLGYEAPAGMPGRPLDEILSPP